VKLIKNVLTEEHNKDLCNCILSDSMPWYFNNTTSTYFNNKRSTKELFHFTHVLIKNGEINNNNLYYLTLIELILKSAGLQKVKVLRAKFNLLPRQSYTDKDLKNTIHKDSNLEKLYSIIYYPHDCDGDTVIYKDNGDIINITPKANTAVMFKSQLLHRATPPSIAQNRIVLNIIFKVD
jgi:hypothetical protein